MSHIAEMLIDHPDHNLNPTLGAASDAHVQVKSQPATLSDPPTLFYLVETDDFRSFEAALADDHTVAEWDRVADVDGSRFYRVTYTDAAMFLTPTLTDLGLRILDATSGDGGWEFRLHVPEREQLARFLSYCEDEGIRYELRKVYSVDSQADVSTDDGGGPRLTDRQREVARTATEMGYFESDGASTADIADELDITPSTLSSHLRTITAKVFERHFGE